MNLQQKQKAFEDRLIDLIRIHENTWIIAHWWPGRKIAIGDSYEYDDGTAPAYTDKIDGGNGEWVWDQIPARTQAELVEQWIQQIDSVLQENAWNHQLDELVRSLLGEGDTAQAGEEFLTALKVKAPDEIIDQMNSLFNRAMGVEHSEESEAA